MQDDTGPGKTSRSDWQQAVSRWAEGEAWRPVRGGRHLPRDTDTPGDTLHGRELYRSANGDCWHLVLDATAGRVFVRHEANPASGGQVTDIEVAAFLAAGQGPEQQELLRLIGTMADVEPPGSS
ncbi:MAG TPA: hypothetical protein VEB20_03400 [Azospirillaceae bacterium]|nr:hypothetical protein [Azospirillaceae bacterium]